MPLPDGAERLLTHFVGGWWRVPLSTRHAEAGQGLRVVLAGPEDAARALSLAAGPAPQLLMPELAPDAALASAAAALGAGGACIWLARPETALATVLAARSLIRPGEGRLQLLYCLPEEAPALFRRTE